MINDLVENKETWGSLGKQKHRKRNLHHFASGKVCAAAYGPVIQFYGCIAHSDLANEYFRISHLAPQCTEAHLN